MEKSKELLKYLNPNGKKKKKFSVYLSEEELNWLKKLTEANQYPSKSQFLAALLDREIELFEEEK